MPDTNDPAQKSAEGLLKLYEVEKKASSEPGMLLSVIYTLAEYRTYDIKFGGTPHFYIRLCIFP